jgi:hypothetical protein
MKSSKVFDTTDDVTIIVLCAVPLDEFVSFQVVTQSHKLLRTLLFLSSALLHYFNNLSIVLSFSPSPSNPSILHWFVALVAALTMACVKIALPKYLKPQWPTSYRTAGLPFLLSLQPPLYIPNRESLLSRQRTFAFANQSCCCYQPYHTQVVNPILTFKVARNICASSHC